jgi:hypothetical protein
MADTGRKQFKAQLKADPRDEMTKAAKEFVDSDNGLKKIVVDFTYSEKVELDPRKWTDKSLNEGVFAVARYEIKIFATRIGEMAKAGISAKDAKPKVKVLHTKTQGYIDKKLSLAVEELASDKGDSKKALKDGKLAMSKIQDLDLKDAFSKPRNDVVKLLKAIASAKDPAPAIKKAATEVAKHAKDFDKTGREASAAVGYLLKMIKDHKSSDAPGMGEFVALANKKSSTFSDFVTDCEQFENALDELTKALAAGDMDADTAKAKSSEFAGMTKVDGTAKAALAEAKLLKTKFDAVAKTLK